MRKFFWEKIIKDSDIEKIFELVTKLQKDSVNNKPLYMYKNHKS